MLKHSFFILMILLVDCVHTLSLHSGGTEHHLKGYSGFCAGLRTPLRPTPQFDLFEVFALTISLSHLRLTLACCSMWVLRVEGSCILEL